MVRRNGFNRFSAPELCSVALEKYPDLDRGSFVSRVIACTPNHPSYKHHKSRRDYFSRISPGLYWLDERYAEKSALDDLGSLLGLEKAR